MARNGSGSYSLPAGNPVTTGTQITATWGNTTLSDIAAEITNSVAADGQTTITGPLKCAAGSVSAPSFTFSAETNTGFYKSASNVVSLAIAGSQKYILGASSVTLAGSASITGTEFGYLTGVSSAIQTQLDAKQGLDATLTALAGTLTAANKIPYATATNTASELTFNPSTTLAASTSTVPSQTVVKTAVDELVANCSTATPDTSADYFVFEDATDNTQKKSLIENIIPAKIIGWCVFNGTIAGTNAPINGYNVTSVTRNGTGSYDINFTSALPNTNYAAIITPRYDTAVGDTTAVIGVVRNSGVLSTTVLPIQIIGNVSAAAFDAVRISVVVFG